MTTRRERPAAEDPRVTQEVEVDTTEALSTAKDTISVTGKTPAGHAHTFTLRVHDRVDKTTRELVTYFTRQHLLDDGDYGLALVRGDVAQPLQEAARLEDYGVVDGDILVLVNKAPQVDG